MTSGRFWFPTFVLSFTGAVLLASSGCGGTSRGCLQCPPMEGRYALELSPGTLPSSCNGVTVELPEGPLEVARQGGDITATLDGVTLRGTLYDTYDFGLVGGGAEPTDGGTGGPESSSLTGRYIPAVGDGGVPRLEGDWQGNFASSSAGGPRRCSVTRSFTATRQ
ncbi:hypothetical protein [Archangium lipolyticum]|uniref:hypothetical protein n=1 Tax=Archangium lipolyticum TaxID=2970465 RepID=UPI002149CFF4|nr:hypothetical protein [Archangium lipolyticum]